jgi:agmatinase
MIATLIGLPYDHHSSHLRGAAQAPPLIRKALWSDGSNPFSETGVDVSSTDVMRDAGDLDAPEGDAHEAIEDAVTRILDAGERPVCLGGDHAVTWPVLRALAPRHEGLTILHVDAHPDLYDSFDGDPLSHASPFARIMEQGLAKRLVQVGIRTLNPHQREQVARFGVECIEMRHRSPMDALVLDGPVYVSIDLDGLDPAHAPGVSHPEPGGLATRDVIDLLHGITGDVVGADVVEYNPQRDVHDLTAHVAAKLVKEIVGVMAAAK